MRLTPQERDRLLVASAAAVAQRRRERGLRLNVPETVALVADCVIEAARDGCRLAEAVGRARSLLGPDDVLVGVADVVTQVRVEAVFDDGTRLVVVPDPVGGGHLRDEAPGAVVPAPLVEQDGTGHDGTEKARAEGIEVEVVNTAAVPVSVTSHWHFFEANPRLRFDRAAAYGMRLAVDAGAAVRFEPGVPQRVRLVPIGGARVAVGFAGLVDGPLDDPAVRGAALERLAQFGYLTTDEADGAAADGDEGHGSAR